MVSQKYTRNIFYILAIIGIVFIGFLYYSKTLAQESCGSISCDGLEGADKKECEKKKKDCEELEEKAEAYEKIIKLKEKQQSALGGQINSLDGEIKETQVEIEQNKGKIDDLNGEVKELERQIEQKQELLEVQKELLKKIIRVYYENSQEDAFSLMIKSGGFAVYMNQGDFLSQTGAKIQDTLRNIKNIQNKLKEEIQKIEEKKSEIVDASNELEDRNSYLLGTKTQKRTLLIQTQGEEKKYQDKLKKLRLKNRNCLEILINYITLILQLLRI